jgi:hypothetical protein
MEDKMFKVNFLNDRGDEKTYATCDFIEEAFEAVDMLVEREIKIVDVLSGNVIYEENN